MHVPAAEHELLLFRIVDFINFGDVDVNYPINAYGNLLSDRDPRIFALNPKRGRDAGVEFQYRF